MLRNSYLSVPFSVLTVCRRAVCRRAVCRLLVAGVLVSGLGSTESPESPAANPNRTATPNTTAAETNEANWLASASLEELMRVRVVSAARREQALADVAAAVYVVTQDDIRRSGAATIPDALRMVPGLHVAQVSSSSWAISARGFTGRFANKMLVLIDGRSVYTNLYSGVYWEQNDLLMEDIERIEVIRGPGATMWGANAVNGVINIITASSKKTQGTLVSLQSGLTEPFQAAVRYGGKVGDRFHYRFAARAHSLGPQLDSRLGATGDADDAWRGNQFSMRADWQPNERDEVMVQSNLYRSSAHQTIDTDFPSRASATTLADVADMSGGMALVRWKRSVSGKSDLTLQTSYSMETREESYGRGEFGMLDVDFQHHYRLSRRHDTMWGVGYRLYRDEIRGGPLPNGEHRRVFDPDTASDNLYTLFAQDEIALIPDRLTLTVGTKIQHNPYTEFDLQPSIRLMWSPSERTSYWAAASRAVRVPSRRDVAVAIDFPAPPPAPPNSVIRMRGNPDALSESVVAYEAGYRKQFGRAFVLDAAVFQSNYRQLQRGQIGAPLFEMQPVFRMIIPANNVNDGSPILRGAEIAATWAPHFSWKLSANYSYLWHDKELNPVAGEWPPSFPGVPHLTQFRSSWDMTPRLSLDASAYRVSRLERFQIPAYWRADLRLGFRLNETLDLSLTGQNLTDASHREFVSEDFVRSVLLRRNVRLGVAWRW